MFSLFLFVVIVAVALGIIAVAVKGLLWLLAVGVVILLIDFLVLGARMRGRRRRPAR